MTVPTEVVRPYLLRKGLIIIVVQVDNEGVAVESSAGTLVLETKVTVQLLVISAKTINPTLEEKRLRVLLGRFIQGLHL